ncbi:hypothetical protein N8D56_04975 [Devosia sp. A8/3-2]|nr:hypothetical protein N8D56_04975 [Devosia sp. A8/3-2]
MSDAVKALTASEAPAESDEDQPADDDAQQDDDADDELLSDEDGEDEGETDEDAEQAADEDDDSEEDDEEAEGEPGPVVADDARVKLADGTFVTVAELKAGTLRRDDYTRKTRKRLPKSRPLRLSVRN